MSVVRVLVVDDSVVVRRLVADVLAADPGIEVVGTAPNGRVALAKIDLLAPDLVTLDIEMPVMDGLQTLVELRKTRPRLPVVMFSTLTERGAMATLEALERGADDYVTKPSNVGSVDESREAVRTQLVPKIQALAKRSSWLADAPVAPRRAEPSRPVQTKITQLESRVDVLVVGSSTGGPEALNTFVTALPADLPVPVLIVQHMPPVFTKHFAERLDKKVALHVREAAAGDAIEPGTVLIAPGDFHMTVAGGAAPVVALDQGPKENFCRPAVDVLFRSAAARYGANVLGVVLTGMGADGAQGSLVINEAGGAVIAQDQATSVVWGMPGAVVAAGAAHDVLPLLEIADAVTTRCRRNRPLHLTAAPGGAIR